MRTDLPAIIAGMAIVTFLPRFLPMAFLTRWAISERVRTGLGYVPVAVLSAIVFPVLFFNEEGAFGIHPRLLLSALPVIFFSWKVRSLWVAVIVGMLVYWLVGLVPMS